MPVRHALPKLDAGYDTSPVGMRQGFRCETCVNWNPDGSCSVVTGRLAPDQCCNLWSAVARTELPAKLSQENAVVVGPPPDGGNSHACGVCRYFTGPRGCMVVAGDIDPKATCYLWTP